MEREVSCRMALVITVRDIAADLQTVLRLLQVICLLKVSVNCYTDYTIFSESAVTILGLCFGP